MVVDARCLGGDSPAVGGVDRFVHGAKSLFPCVGDLGRQARAVDARAAPFQVGLGPEELREVRGQRLQAVVVQRRPALAQVVNEQVADGTAGDAVAVDQLLRRTLAGTPRLTQRRRTSLGG